MTIERPRLRADQVLVGDRLLYTDALSEDSAVPAMPVVEGRAVEGDSVLLTLDGREVSLPADAEAVVERAT